MLFRSIKCFRPSCIDGCQNCDDLNIKSKSSIAVKESTPINISQDGILISDSSGKNQLLNLQDLTSIWNNSKTKVITTSNEK